MLLEFATVQSHSLFAFCDIKVGDSAAQLAVAVPLNIFSTLKKSGDLILGRYVLQVEMTYDLCQHMLDTTFIHN